jgi:IS5 family transposase
MTLIQMEFQNFILPFGGELDGENRWVILANQIPWQRIEQEYSALFSQDEGCPAKAARVGFGALIIKERLGITDRETVEQICENPYLQYFLGFSGFSTKAPFHHSLMTRFRQRFSKEILAIINEWIVAEAVEHSTPEHSSDEPQDSDDDNNLPPNSGEMILDATCTPADITYPTDLKLLNEAREKMEKIIDVMHGPDIATKRKPRTYRQVARKDYLDVAKQKKPGYKKIRRAIGHQLHYLTRNLQNIETMVNNGRLGLLDKRDYRNLLVLQELYRQQLWMVENRTHSVHHRIVSISQPHVRPIVRGKARSNVEFGAKISVSMINGFGYVDRINWESYNESDDLTMQIEKYFRRFGCYPLAVLADKIYRTRENRNYCKERGIRLSGPPLGRPKKITEMNTADLKKEKQIHYQDELDRNAIEGKFGQGKRRFTLGLIMAKLAQTSEAVISISFIVMNLEKILSILFSFLAYHYQTYCQAQHANAPDARNRFLPLQIAA